MNDAVGWSGLNPSVPYSWALERAGIDLTLN